MFGEQRLDFKVDAPTAGGVFVGLLDDDGDLRIDELTCRSRHRSRATAVEARHGVRTP